MNIDLVTRDLIRSVRGSKSQIQLSRRMGFKGNQLYRWEAGIRTISWTHFVEMSGTCQVDVRRALKKNFGYQGDPSRSDLLCKLLIGDARLSEVSRQTKISKFSLVRWRKGNATPSLEQMLILIHHCQIFLIEFLEALVPIETIPAIQKEYRQRALQKELFYKHPAATAVLCCLNLDTYRTLRKHVDGFIAKKTGIGIEEEQNILESLVRLRVIYYKDEKYYTSHRDFDLRTANFENEKKIRSYWIARAERYLHHMKKPLDLTEFKANVFPVSSKGAKRIKEELLALYLKMQAIAGADTGHREHLIIFTSQLFGMSELENIP